MVSSDKYKVIMLSEGYASDSILQFNALILVLKDIKISCHNYK